MGRKERRKQERYNRIENRKGKVYTSPAEIKKLKHEISHDVSKFDTEILMTCFAQALRNVTKKEWGYVRIMRVLAECDRLFGEVLEGNLDDVQMRQNLKDEIGLVINCDGGSND